MTKKLAFLGYGLRSKTMLQAFREIEADISVAAVADPRWEQIKEENAGDPLFAEARYFENADALLGGCEPDGVFIGTRCPLHTPLAVEVLKRDIPLFLEKPVCISEAQYRTLREAAEGKLDRAVVSFPLRVADITVRLRQLVESGALGRVTMVQAVNNVPYGSVYYHSWYRDPSLTGGLFLQKTTHDIDYICHAAGLTPKRVFAHTEKLYYKGDRPAGLHCPDCPDYRTCVESSYASASCAARTCRAIAAASPWIPATRMSPRPCSCAKAARSSAIIRTLPSSARRPDAAAASSERRAAPSLTSIPASSAMTTMHSTRPRRSGSGPPAAITSAATGGWRRIL